MLDLGFGASTFRFAARPGTYATTADLAGARIATSYPGVVGRFLVGQRHQGPDVIRLDGAVENAVGLGLADVIADVVDTGSTLRQAGLEPVGEPLLHVDRGADPRRQSARQRADHPARRAASAGCWWRGGT